MNIKTLISFKLIVLVTVCFCPLVADGQDVNQAQTIEDNSHLFPSELVDFVPFEGNPVLIASGPKGWDIKIRERGWIMKESDGYHLWFTGYDGTRKEIKNLGYATSPDGIHWKKYPDNPILKDHWIEDMMIVKKDKTYFMFAEGVGDHTHLFSSEDKVHWKHVRKIDIRYTDGTPLSEGPYGTPTAWLENGKWYLFYERRDQGIWLATSDDMKVWTHVQDEPVIKLGPGHYDNKMVAMNQIVKYKNRYYTYYHGLGKKAPYDTWTSNVAVSQDLLHWKKYSGNPILQDNKSSALLIHDGKEFRLYSMHNEVHLHFPKNKKPHPANR